MMRNLFVFSLMLITSILSAQEFGGLKGTVLDEEMNNDPLMFARVELKDTDVTVQTNLHGNFEIDGIEPGTYTLVIRYLGYENSEVPVRIEENKVTYIHKGLHAKSISVGEVAGLESSAEEKGVVSPDREKTIRR
jgi:hypothetical protein